MKVSQRFALDHWLSDYPDDKSYVEIIEGMINEEEWVEEFITVWQVVEGYSPRQVAGFIESTSHHFKNVVENLSKGEEI